MPNFTLGGAENLKTTISNLSVGIYAACTLPVIRYMRQENSS